MAKKLETPLANGALPQGQQQQGAAAPELAALASVAELLGGPPAADGYSQEQKRGCISCALRLQDPKINEVLWRLHQLAIPAWGRGSRSVEALMHKMLAVLLDVRAGAADSLASAVVWRLARERTWKKEVRLRALALLLKSPSAAEEELVKLALRSTPQAISVSALCVLYDAEAVAEVSEAKEAVVARLGRSRLPPALEAASMSILSTWLQCEPSGSKVLAHLPSSNWGADTIDAAKRVVARVERDASQMARDSAPELSGTAAGGADSTGAPSKALSKEAEAAQAPHRDSVGGGAAAGGGRTPAEKAPGHNSGAEVAEGKAAAKKAASAERKKDTEADARGAPGSGRFGLGLLELEPLDDEDDGDGKEDGWGALKALVDEDDDDGEDEDDDDDKVVEDDDAQEREEEDECSAFSENVESYAGSELEPLDFAEDSDAESDEDAGNDSMDLGSGGLLTSMFGGGSLHSEEKARRRPQRALAVPRAQPKIRVVFPSLIWRGKDVLVVNKPADWICSASDVDKKKGRPLDPNEKCQVKGFKVLDDLLQYKFGDREKKYIHWWIQLMHDLDHKAYPNLFDEDQNYGLCHRLDRETSGTVLVGLTQLARQQMRECFHRHYVRKLYVCLVHGVLDQAEQTVDRNLEAMGQKARLHPNGKRARTHVKVLAGFTRPRKGGGVDEYTLCTCEIAEGRMHQIRLHMSGALGAPIVSEFYYQKAKQMIEDRRWCQRVFLHAYAVGFPDVSGESRRIGCDSEQNKDCGLVEEEKRDTEQEWHCCICPLTVELRAALQEMTPKDEQAAKLFNTLCDCGLMDTSHEAVHVMGTEGRKGDIDSTFFPWSSNVNPIEVGDLSKPRDVAPARGGKGKGKFKDREPGETSALRPKARPKRRANMALGRRGASASPRGRGGDRRGGALGGKRMRIASRGRLARSPCSRSRSRDRTPPQQAPLPRQGRCRSRSNLSGVRRGRSISRGRRLAGGPPSPRRSLSGPPRRKRRRAPSPSSLSPPRGNGGGPLCRRRDSWN